MDHSHSKRTRIYANQTRYILELEDTPLALLCMKYASQNTLTGVRYMRKGLGLKSQRNTNSDEYREWYKPID